MKKDIVYTILESMLLHSPERSYKRLNPALRGTLENCIRADLPFAPETFSRIHQDLRGGWWFGDGGGTGASGEHFYTLACSVNHATAIKSFEQFAGRPGVLWDEDKTAPQRLHVGARFTWKGYYVTVTSMRRDSLVACTYNEARQVAKRFTIPYAEIAEFRRDEAKRVRAILAEIEQCDPEHDAERLSKRVSDEHFRHFQLETIKAAFEARRVAVAGDPRIDAWRRGVNGAYLHSEKNVLRILGDRVQCSNGNSVGLDAVRRVLPQVMARRQSRGALSIALDGHTVKSITKKGVTVGCTFVEWAEVERLNEQVNALSAPGL